MGKLLVTGGAGFIGSNFIHYWLNKYPEEEIINLDLLTYAGNLNNLKDFEDDPRYRFVQGDIGDFSLVSSLMMNVDRVVHFAAESHNDRAIAHPDIFFRTNILGTQTLLEAARRAQVKRFHHISTCEVFGDLALDDPRAFKESDPYSPRTPYNASKAGANHVVMAYHHTYGLPVTISHCCNNYGPYQFPEKLLPLFTTNALLDKPLPLFRSTQNRREWIHVDDHSEAVDCMLQRGTVGEAYNIGTGVEKNIEEIANIVLKALNKPESLKVIVLDRLGHDRRYLLNCDKLKDTLGWSSKISFEDGVMKTIQWYIDHPNWWKPLKTL